ncbi:MAG: hypothetical protein Q9183_007339, partial [Haloplaca sp. 2 TL-2023]
AAVNNTSTGHATQMPREMGISGSSAGATPQKRVDHFVKWLAEGEVDVQAVADSSQEIISLYDSWEQYSEKTCKEQISRCIKAKGLDK